MASQSSGKATFAAIAAQPGGNLNMRPDTGYDKRRAFRIIPADGAAKLEIETCKKLVKVLGETVGPKAITVIRMISEAEFQAVLETPTQVDEICRKTPLIVGNQKLEIIPFVARSTKIWIYNPSILIGINRIKYELEKHCRVAYIEDIPNEYGASTGKLFAYVKGENIPSAIFIGLTRLNITYKGMERKCRLCQSADHAAGKCPERSCYNCDKKGHVSAECEERCKKCGATTHTSRNCMEDVLDIKSRNQFPELAQRTPKDNNKTNGHTTPDVTDLDKDETQQMDNTADRITIDNALIDPPDAFTCGTSVPTEEDADGAEISIEDIIQEAAAALPTCGERTLDAEAGSKTETNMETETQSSESDMNMETETANKRKRREKKRNTVHARTTTTTNKKTKADNSGTKNSAKSDPSATETLKP